MRDLKADFELISDQVLKEIDDRAEELWETLQPDNNNEIAKGAFKREFIKKVSRRVHYIAVRRGYDASL